MGAIMGIVGGSQKEKTTSTGTVGATSWMDVAEAGKQETQARDASFGAVTGLEAALKKLESSPVMSNLERLLAEMGQGPSAERQAEANKFAADMFAPQQTALNQSMEDQRRQFANTAAQMGRSSSDPILAAKLAQEQIRQQSRLTSEQGAFAANEAMTGASRQFSQGLGGLQGLSQNAIQNRQAVFSLGSDFANTQMQYRLATARKFGNQTSFGDQQSGGGLRGAMLGGIAGMGADAKAASAFNLF